MQSTTNISVLGCGWLGLPLAGYLVSEGYQVKGSTTTPAKLALLAAQNIKPYLINLAANNTEAPLTDFLETDILITNFPPRLRANKGEEYLKQINSLAAAINRSSLQHILFISSTSVYPDLNQVVTEGENLIPYLVDNILMQAENIITNTREKAATVVRLAGLVGNNRHPGRFFAGKTNIANPGSPVNLIHLADCVQLLSQVIIQSKWGEVYNGCAPLHPTRQAFYTAATLALNLPLPHFSPPQITDTYKIINADKIIRDLNCSFIHPDPMRFPELTAPQLISPESLT